MQLIYKIDFNTTNEYYINIIKNLILQSNINIDIKKYNKYFVLFINDSENKIESFFKVLESNLPLSVFFKNAKFVESLDEQENNLTFDNLKQNISLTNSEVFKLTKKLDSSFDEKIKELKAGKIVSINASNATYNFSLANIKNKALLEQKDEVKLFVSNINELSKLVSLSKKDIELLCSIERPLVKVKFNLLQNANNEYSDISFIYAKLPEDEITFKFALALKANGINCLLYNQEDIKQKDLIVSYNENNNILIKGDKTLFPKYDYIYKKVYNSSKEMFDENGGVFKTILRNERKSVSTNLGIYFSKKNKNSSISVNIPSKGIKNIIYIPNIQNSLKNLINEVSNIDENTQRLIKNYQNKFNVDLEQELPQATSGFESIINFIAYMLNMKNHKTFESFALSNPSKSGIQIDMKIVKIDNKNFLDYRKIVHSMLSYKIAGVDNALLAYSFYESLSEFIKNMCDEIKKDIKFESVILCGDMFSNSILLSKTKKELLNCHNITISYNTPLDY